MIVADISKMETTNWPTTKMRLGSTAFCPGRNVPFNVFTGLNEERYKCRITARDRSL